MEYGSSPKGHMIGHYKEKWPKKSVFRDLWEVENSLANWSCHLGAPLFDCITAWQSVLRMEHPWCQRWRLLINPTTWAQLQFGGIPFTKESLAMATAECLSSQQWTSVLSHQWRTIPWKIVWGCVCARTRVHVHVWMGTRSAVFNSVVTPWTSSPGSSVCGIFQAIILKQVAVSYTN